jgi:beta-galactosidase
MRELAWVHRPVAVTMKGTGVKRRLVVSNRRHFTDLADLVGEWTMTVEGVPTKSGTLRLDVAAGRERAVPLPCSVPKHGEAHLVVRWRTRKASAWCDKGHVVAWDCLALTPTRSRRPVPTDAATCTASAGEISPRLTLWRAPTDNDGMKLAPRLWPMFGKSLQRWLEQGIDSRDPEDLVNHRHFVEHRDDGSVLHRHVVTVPRALADLPRLGIRFALPVGFERLRWFGDGPHECYPDRRSSAITSVWEAHPDELPYLVPQEHGLRTNCRWMEFHAGVDSATDEVIRVTAVGRPLHMSALFHTPEDLYEAVEQGLVPRRDALTVHLDVAHRGVGTASCGPDTLEQYRVAPGRYEFAYLISSRRSTPRRRQQA